MKNLDYYNDRIKVIGARVSQDGFTGNKLEAMLVSTYDYHKNRFPKDKKFPIFKEDVFARVEVVNKALNMLSKPSSTYTKVVVEENSEKRKLFNQFCKNHTY